MDDVAAVMGAASSSQAVLFGYSEGGADEHPVRRRASGAGDRADPRGGDGAAIPGRPIIHAEQGSDEMFEALTEIAAHRWGQGATIEWFLPSRAGSPEARRLFARFERMAVSPSAFLRIVRMIRQIDVRGRPARHPRADAGDPASRRPHDAPLPRTLPGLPHRGRPLFRAARRPRAAVRRRRGQRRADRRDRGFPRQRAGVPETPTGCWPPSCWPRRRAAAGRSRGRRASRPRVRAYRGRLIENSQAGVLATFAAPGQAIRCAAAIRDDAAARGVQIRAGIHAGEVDLAGDDVDSPSVRIARCLAALAPAGRDPRLAGGQGPGPRNRHRVRRPRPARAQRGSRSMAAVRGHPIRLTGQRPSTGRGAQPSAGARPSSRWRSQPAPAAASGAR